MHNLALADISEDDLQVMLDENETLFVEHKTALGGEGFQVAKAICSFANTLGGWVLIGVTDGRPNAGQDGGWKPLAATEIADQVRQVLEGLHVDPIPPFAATVNTLAEQPIGVVRIYESSDTPHVLRGTVFVRSVAQDRRYEARGVDTQAALLAIAQRGRDGVQRARERFLPARAPLAERGVGVLTTYGKPHVQATRVALRAAPVTAMRLEDWAVSQQAHDSAVRTVRALTRRGADPEPTVTPAASGLIAEIGTDGFQPIVPDLEETHSWNATAAVDAAGMVGASVVFGDWTPARPKVHLTLNGIRDAVVRPLLDAVVLMLDDAELHGRSILELRLGGLEPVIVLDDEGGAKQIPSNLPLGGEVTLPLDTDVQAAALAQRWRDDIGRSAGYLTLRR